ncbi:uncharacterized protein LOC126101195 [Schistocerca cancellata]|uniref:uncharacterized protein LOC126101195 n=1 Tax=Schistocerca cancellata TaxID=274614 RepID=UPI00211869F0|nr:uncharacterized protein LOC126101195 [Schistocerca cancellata]
MCIDSDEQALAVEEYIRIVARVVRKQASGPARLVLLRAAADALAGWLHVRALPRARAAFYAGHISYEPARRLHSLLEEMRCLLRSDGQFWRPAEHVRPVTGARAKRRRRSDDIPEGCSSLLVRGSGKDVRVPLPFLDNPTSPAVLALPVKGRVLVRLDDPGAESLLVHFHDAAEACLAGTPQAQQFHEDVRTLPLRSNRRPIYTMQSWLRQEVSPLLMGEHWYPALGGAAALMDGSRGAGGAGGGGPEAAAAAAARKRLDTWRHAEPAAAVAGPPPAQLPVTGDAGGGLARFFHSLSSWELAALLVASALLVWLKVAFCYVIANCFRRRKKQAGAVTPGGPPGAAAGEGGVASRRSSASSSSSSSGRASILSALVSVLGGAVSPQEQAVAHRASGPARSASQQRRGRQSSSGSRSRSSTSLSQPSVLEARQTSQ